MNLLVFISVFLSFLPASHAVQCILYHEFTQDITKDISMVKSTCYASKYCVHVHYKDENPRKKQGFSVGCDRTDCQAIQHEKGWNKTANGQICKRHKDYGTGGKICCCTKDFCNGIASVGMGLSLMAAVLLWTLA